MAAKAILGPADEKILDRALETNNLSHVTDFYVRPESGGYSVFPGSVRHAQYLAYWHSIGKPAQFAASSGGIDFMVEPRYDGKELIYFEKRGFVFLPWQLEFLRATQEQRTIVGTTGTGKTAGIGMMAMVLAAITPNFRFLNVAPTVYQSELMVRAIQDQIVGTRFFSTFLKPGKMGYREKPYALYRFQNGSTCEFMNVENNARNVQSWSGDWINVDEAGLLDQTDEIGQVALGQMLIGLATRLRGTRPDGRPRMGILSLISMAYPNDEFWKQYDLGEVNPTVYYSRTVLHKDNPYLTPKDIERAKRNIPPGQERQWLLGERPSKKGAEFPARLIDELFAESAKDPNAYIEESGPGILTYEVPPDKERVYVMAGDPGMSDPPHRNSPCIMVWDVTNFPLEKARLAAFWWGFGNGSIMPFINKFDEYRERYGVIEMFRGYDSTSSQKAIAELAWATGDKMVVSLGFEGAKKWMYINAAKMLMSRGLLVSPPIYGFRKQMGDYKLPDKKLVQDIVSTFCMVCHLMIPLYREVYPDEEDPDKKPDSIGGLAEVGSRHGRLFGNRGYVGR